MTHIQPVAEATLTLRETKSWVVETSTLVEVTAHAGVLWVTMEGDSEDYVLQAGDTVYLSGPGLLVAQGLASTNRVAVLS